MTSEVTMAGSQPRRLGRSVLAVVLGLVAVVALSLCTDQLLHVLQVYPPWGQPMYDNGLNFLALAYRCVYSVGGGFITAALAPRNPMRHAMILGAIGFVLSLAGAIGASSMNLGPMWYPIALVITAVPTVWLGAMLAIRRARAR